jgi:uracil phosphoribosyltransferase
MLATGGSALEALRVLTQEFGVPPERVVFANVISCPEGLRNVSEAYSRLRRIVTAAVDPVLNGDKYIVPGLGDFGDRYYGTGGGEAAEADGDGDDGSGDGLRGGSAS